jgi:hypothetical protein
MDKIDELERRIEELKQEKRIAELELQVAHLLDEIAALKWRPAYWTPCPDWTYWTPCPDWTYWTPCPDWTYWTWRPQYGPTYYTTSGESTSDTYVAKQ